MFETSTLRIERNIAQCRILLSLAAPLAVYLDPTKPILTRFVEGAAFFIDPHALTIMLVHLAYSIGIFVALRSVHVPPRGVIAVSTWGDVLFGTVVTFVTEGTNSPFYVFFLFAVLAAGLRGTLRTALQVTAVSVALYVGLIVAVRPDGFGFYLTRAVYLAITGYLVGALGRRRLVLESNLQGLTRSLHDGYAQTLASVNLRLEASRELIRLGRTDEAQTELSDLQTGVTREYDELRAYVRSLQGLSAASGAPARADETRFVVRAKFEAPLPLLEHALQIMLEGARNVSRHASAKSAMISATTGADSVVVRIDDDGVGFPPGAAAPWSIASRAAEVGGHVHIRGTAPSGGTVVVELPTA